MLQAIRNRSREIAIAVVTAAPVLAFAQSAGDPFDAALADVTTKVSGYAGALVGLAAVAVAFMVAVKYVKKIPRAS